MPNKINLIIPAAGKSSRFPGVKPKWLLTHPNGELMVTAALGGLDMTDIAEIYLVVLQEHVEKYISLYGIRDAFQVAGIDKPLKILQLPNETNCQPDTVAQAIEHFDLSGPLYIKDVDNFFVTPVRAENSIAVRSLSAAGKVNAGNKSYVLVDDQGLVTNVVEKQVVSSDFSVGGYSFESARDFLKMFKRHENTGDLYVSHIIFAMVLAGVGFRTRQVSDYDDWGTLEDWNEYKSHFKTLFLDLDGVVVKNSGQFFDPQWGKTDGLVKNITLINRLYDSGKTRIVLTTSRTQKYRDATIKQLDELGVRYHEIMFGLFHGQRIVVNDYAPSNPYKSCEAVNIKRDSDTLEELLEAQSGSQSEISPATAVVKSFVTSKQTKTYA